MNLNSTRVVLLLPAFFRSPSDLLSNTLLRALSVIHPTTKHLGLLLVLLLAAPLAALSQTMDHRSQKGSPAHPGSLSGGPMAQHNRVSQPTLPGQDAFAAIQEIVMLLEGKEDTDWSKYDFAALREHLIDMNVVTLGAQARERMLDDGLEIDITGEARTLEGIKGIVPAHAAQLNGLNGWTASSKNITQGVRLTVTSPNPPEVTHIQGLGFIGLMVTGGHHQPHHLALARGEAVHAMKNESGADQRQVPVQAQR